MTLVCPPSTQVMPMLLDSRYPNRDYLILMTGEDRGQNTPKICCVHCRMAQTHDCESEIVHNAGKDVRMFYPQMSIFSEQDFSNETVLRSFGCKLTQ